MQGLSLNSNANIQQTGKLNRIIQDYLIIRVGCLFDKSVKKLFFNNQEFKNIEKDILEKLYHLVSVNVPQEFPKFFLSDCKIAIPNTEKFQ